MLPAHYPQPLATTKQLLDRAHMPEPPFEEVRTAIAWLKSEGEVRSYLERLTQDNIYRWRFGPLFRQSYSA